MNTEKELVPCPYKDLCTDCHPEKNMVEKRKSCNSKNCTLCGVFWAFNEGYFGLDDD